MKKKYVATLHEFVDPYTAAALVVKAGETLVKKYAGGLFSEKGKVNNATSASELKTTSDKKSVQTEVPSVFVEFEKNYVNQLKNLSLQQVLFYLYLKNNSKNEFYNLFNSNELNFTKKLFSYANEFSKGFVGSLWKTKLSQIGNDQKQQTELIENMKKYFETLHEDAEDIVSATKLLEKLKEIK